MFMYSLDGKIKMYQTIISEWKNDDLLRMPQEVKVISSSNKEEANIKSDPPQQKFEEQKKLSIVIPVDYSNENPQTKPTESYKA